MTRRRPATAPRSGATRPTTTWSTGGSTTSTRAATWPSSRATWSRSPTGSSARRRRGDRQRRRLPLQGRPRDPRPHLRHARVPGRPHRRVHLDRVERVRPLLRGVLRHAGHADPARRDRGLPVRRGAGAGRGEAHHDRGDAEGSRPRRGGLREPHGRRRRQGRGRGNGRRGGRPARGLPLRDRRASAAPSARAARSSARRSGPWARRSAASRASRRSRSASGSPCRGRPEAVMAALPGRPETRFRTKQEYVYQELRQSIMRCELAPGERLVIDVLARTPAGLRDPDPRGAAAAPVGGPGGDRASRRRHRGADLGGVDRRVVRHHGGPRDGRRAGGDQPHERSRRRAR